ncbi:MAG: hypothetical protein CMJ31_05495 [Phycisphaerae bacterium]|nr:hypothetical protein [Phycisphaerae bacterium]
MVVSILAVIWMVTRDTAPAMERLQKAEALRGEILHLDEVLTMSAYMAAASGDLKWRDRYMQHVGDLDAAITALRDISPELFDSEVGGETDAANRRLVAAEERAFELIESGDRDGAWELLNGPSYRQNKVIYARGMDRADQAVRARLFSERRRMFQRIMLAGLVSGISLALVSFAWLRAFGMIQRLARVSRRAAEADAALVAAEASNQLKNRFMAHMSHELRTPVTSIIGYGESLLLAPRDADETRRRVRIICESARHLERIIADVLDISRIEMNEFGLKPGVCNPRELLERAQSLVAPMADRHGIEVWIDISPDTPARFVSDPTRVSQILINLASNAVKFTEKGSVTLRSLATTGQAGEPCIAFEVIDTGPGIAQNDLTRVFDPFEQADYSMSRRSDGVGLGLPISRGLARLMGGDITVTSRVGRGSLFTLRLPLDGMGEVLEATDEIEEERLTPVMAPMGAPEPAPAVARPANAPRVLLAEDMEVNRLLFVEMLASLGYDATEAENGLEAVEIVKREGTNAFEFVFMDMQMPELDGYEATRRLRKMEMRVPVIAVTAHGMDGDRERCIEAGCSDHLVKPFSLGDLDEMIGRWKGKVARSAA